MNTQDLTLAGLAVVPLIVGVTELAKIYVPSKYAALIALALGVAAGVGAQATLPHPVWINGVVVGVAAGLAASGLFSGIAKLAADPAPTAPPPAYGVAPIPAPTPAPTPPPAP